MTTGADWLDTARRVVDTFLAAPAAASPTTGSEATAGEAAGHADTCRWCPVCQAVAVARGERPEVTAALADLLTTTAGALRTFAESVPAPEQGAAADTDGDADGADDGDVPPGRRSGTETDAAADLPEEEREPTRTVQRIEIA
jgi:hypothetical protein